MAGVYEGDPKKLREYKAIKTGLDEIHSDIFENMGLCETIPLKSAVEAVRFLLFNMTGTNDLSIMFSSAKLWEIPVSWLCDNLENILIDMDTAQFDINDDYDYCRISDAVSHIPQLLEIVIQVGLKQENLEVRNFAQENQALLPKGSTRFYEHTINYFKYLGLL